MTQTTSIQVGRQLDGGRFLPFFRSLLIDRVTILPFDRLYPPEVISTLTLFYRVRAETGNEGATACICLISGNSLAYRRTERRLTVSWRRRRVTFDDTVKNYRNLRLRVEPRTGVIRLRTIILAAPDPRFQYRCTWDNVFAEAFIPGPITTGYEALAEQVYDTEPEADAYVANFSDIETDTGGVVDDLGAGVSTVPPSTKRSVIKRTLSVE